MCGQYEREWHPAFVGGLECYKATTKQRLCSFRGLSSKHLVAGVFWAWGCLYEDCVWNPFAESEVLHEGMSKSHVYLLPGLMFFVIVPEQKGSCIQKVQVSPASTRCPVSSGDIDSNAFLSFQWQNRTCPMLCPPEPHPAPQPGIQRLRWRLIRPLSIILLSEAAFQTWAHLH